MHNVSKLSDTSLAPFWGSRRERVKETTSYCCQSVRRATLIGFQALEEEVLSFENVFLLMNDWFDKKTSFRSILRIIFNSLNLELSSHLYFKSCVDTVGGTVVREQEDRGPLNYKYVIG